MTGRLHLRSWQGKAGSQSRTVIEGTDITEILNVYIRLQKVSRVSRLLVRLKKQGNN